MVGLQGEVSKNYGIVHSAYLSSSHRLLMSSACLEELRLEGNSIGDGGAREVMEGLTLRKEGGLPTMRVGVTSCVSPDLFAAIVELTSSKAAKKKGKKKRKKVVGL